jgi:hypothetical protein
VLRYSARVLVLPELYAGGLGVVTLLWLVDRWPQQLWQLAGVAAALAGAAASCLFDEPAASIVDTLPRPRWWRTTARLLPVAVLVALWVTAASMVDPADIGRVDVLRLQGAGAILIGVALTTWLRRRGRPAPGPIVAGALLLVLTYAATMNPIDGELPLFPYGPQGAWAASRLLWMGLATVAALAVAASCTEGSSTHRAVAVIRGSGS